jgi:pimeloyl-ACP methyl ester carboxylesterase
MNDSPITRLPWQELSFMTEADCHRGTHLLNVADSDPNNTTDRPVLVFFHGVLRNWQSFYPLLPALQDRFRLVAVDFRGHGKSDPVPDGYRVIDYVADAVSVISELPGKVHVYGHSLGAMVALAACARLPDRITTAILEDPPFSTMGHRITQLPLLQYFQSVEQCVNEDFTAHPSIDETDAQNAARVERLFAAFSDLIVDQNADGTPVRIRDQRDRTARRFAAESFARLDPAVLQPITSAKWLNGYDLDSVLSGVQSNVILLQADTQAAGMLTDDEARQVCDQLNERCEHIYFKDVGHSIHWTEPDRIVERLLQL